MPFCYSHPLFVFLGIRVYPRAALYFMWSCLICCLFPEAVGGLIGVCVDVIPLVFGFFAWVLSGAHEAGPRDVISNSRTLLRPSLFERSGTAPSERAWLVDNTCVFYAAVDGRSRHLDVHQEQVQDPSYLACVRSVEVADAPVALSSEADASGLEPLGSALALEVDDQSNGADVLVAEAREQEVAQAAWLPEHNDPMVVDPWYWQGIVTFEYMPELPGVNGVIPMEVDVSEPFLDVVMAEPDDFEATQVGAPLEEDSDMELVGDFAMAEPLLEEDVVMTEVEDPGDPMDVDPQQPMEFQEHLDRGVEPGVQEGGAVGAEASSSEGDRPEEPESREEGAKEDTVLNKGAASVATAATALPGPRSEEGGRRPALKASRRLNKASAVLNKVAAPAPLPAEPSDEVLVKHSTVLNPAQDDEQGVSEDRSQDVGPSNDKGKHRVGCTCAPCAEEAEDLEEKLAIWASFDQSDEEEEESVDVPESSTASMTRTDRRSGRSGSKAE